MAMPPVDVCISSYHGLCGDFNLQRLRARQGSIRVRFCMAAVGMNDFAVAFQTLDPAFEKEKGMLLLAAGEISSWVESDTPFAENALIVVSDSLPAEYADEYEVLKP